MNIQGIMPNFILKFPLWWNTSSMMLCFLFWSRKWAETCRQSPASTEFLCKTWLQFIRTTCLLEVHRKLFLSYCNSFEFQFAMNIAIHVCECLKGERFHDCCVFWSSLSKSCKGFLVSKYTLSITKIVSSKNFGTPSFKGTCRQAEKNIVCILKLQFLEDSYGDRFLLEHCCSSEE